MKYLFILDLSGTLIEAAHVCYRKELDKINPYFNEYYSRINYIGRKLNQLLENNYNRIVILSSEDHSTIEDIELIIKDINRTILDKNKDRIEYYVAVENIVKKENSIYCVMENDNKIIKVREKSIVYDKVLEVYPQYYPITIDDRPSFQCFSKVLQKNGECYFIQNEINSIAIYQPETIQRFEKRYHVRDNIDTLISHYEHCTDIFSFSYKNIEEMPEYLKFSTDDAYQMLYNGTLNVDNFYKWRYLTDIKKGFIEQGYSLEYIESLIKHHCIDIFPSFEIAYQKRILPKITKK